MHNNITIHTYKKEAIQNLASFIIKDNKEMIDPRYLDSTLSKVNNFFFASHSPIEIAKMMVGQTYEKYVKFVHFEKDEFVQDLASYIMGNYTQMMYQVYSQAHYYYTTLD